MARRRSTRDADDGKSQGAAIGTELTPGVLITFRPGVIGSPKGYSSICGRLENAAGIKNVAFAADFEASATDLAQTGRAGMTVFNAIGVAVADVDPDQEAGIMATAAEDSEIASVEPEPIHFAFADGGASPDVLAYLRGYRDAVNHLHDRLVGPGGARPAGALDPFAGADSFQDTDELTWGLAAVKVPASRGSGRGVRVAVLDTGLDLDHPDFVGRQITSRSFIAGQRVQDGNGHGTHCTGTACGPRGPVRGRRYGIAYETEIFVGKVLSNQGSSLGRSTLAGIEWAVVNGCHVVSMSLGSRVEPGQRFLNAFETPAREAMRRGTLIVAAAGNDSDRSQGVVSPVGSPANCPSIMAVAAVDRFLRTANFSNGSVNPDGRIDIAAPGVAVYSSAPEPAAPRQPPSFRQWAAQYDRISGTSMATPHVAGAAALLRQESPGLTAAELWRVLVARALPLGQPAADVGGGLLQV